MRLKPLHTIWLTLCTTLILLVSSVANSAPLMNLKMMQRNTNLSADILSAEMVANANEHCGSHSMDMPLTQMSADTTAEVSGTDSSGMIHNCCTTACSFVFVSLPIPENHPYPQAYRATISLEVIQPVIEATYDLYRPPIV